MGMIKANDTMIAGRIHDFLSFLTPCTCANRNANLRFKKNPKEKARKTILSIFEDVSSIFEPTCAYALYIVATHRRPVYFIVYG